MIWKCLLLLVVVTMGSTVKESLRKAPLPLIVAGLNSHRKSIEGYISQSAPSSMETRDIPESPRIRGNNKSEGEIVSILARAVSR